MAQNDEITAAHAASGEAVLKALQSTRHGISRGEAAARLREYGLNALPRARPPSMAAVFLRQFASPLIYVLMAAALLSLLIGERSDAGFIFAVLLINALIGTVQEFSAQRAADALQRLVTTRTRVLRGGEDYEIDASELVPGDIVLLESGDRVPADLRLLASRDLEVDESLLTGESLAVLKQAEQELSDTVPLAERGNSVFAGTLVVRGRGRGVVVATGLATALGQIAADVLSRPAAKPPLVVRMERFTHGVAVAVAVAALFMAVVSLMRGTALTEVFLMAVALAVSAIPEGLPVALTVALAIGMRRMAKRNVIVRRLVAVESLGSCTLIATDKTGTLTANQLTVRRIQLPGETPWEVTGEGLDPHGQVLIPGGEFFNRRQALLERLCLAAVLANEAFLGRSDGGWSYHGDALDVALLVMAHKVGLVRDEALGRCPELAVIPFESERMFAASLNRVDGKTVVFVKGAADRLLPLCTRMASVSGDQPSDTQWLNAQVEALAAAGFRVIALAEGEVRGESEFSEQQLPPLTLLGLVGMIDPLRPEAAHAIARCRQAGVEVAMVTGDHPSTALAIARELSLAESNRQIVTGPQLIEVQSEQLLDSLVRDARVFARVEPHQKLGIVRSLQRLGHFVAVSGDGANDAPALRAAQVGVAMGGSGTDVARESADLIITDDNFASLVAGVEEGRIAYANVRKVIFLLISTGAAELVLFVLALLGGLPLPLLAVQLLWLNLVTNGIQDIAMAFEPGEGDELHRPPRSPGEPIFNRLMVERVVLSALVMGSVAYLLFQVLLGAGYTLDEARNGTLLLMVLFENIHVFNSRSETRSVFRHSPLRNPFLLVGTLAAQLVHIGAMYTPWLNQVLGIQPVSPQHWLELLGLAMSVLLAMELHKHVRARWISGSPS